MDDVSTTRVENLHFAAHADVLLMAVDMLVLPPEHSR